MLMIILAIVLTVAVLHFLFNCDPEAKPRADGVYFLGARWWAEKGRAAKHAAGAPGRVVAYIRRAWRTRYSA